MGTVRWYTDPGEDTVIDTGESYVTPLLDTSTTYYVDVNDNGCVSHERIPVTARIVDCNSGPDSVAYLVKGKWYLTMFRGGFGGNTITPVAGDSVLMIRVPKKDSIIMISYNNCKIVIYSKFKIDGLLNDYSSYDWATSNRYIIEVFKPEPEWFIFAQDAYDGSVYWYSRIDTFTQTDPPYITSTSGGARCGQGEVTLEAIADPGIINWYTDISGDTAIARGNSFTTPVLDSTTTYYVEAVYNDCATQERICYSYHQYS